ncbi:Microcystin degradation protein MlrC, contains DUF1485 domain [Rathayibacter oskolensis]|uniref:Microcystin degradation protein MlrC, contains DUF1485 domain n=1 Tax=Rathayibacter oskolensis TaxID=1891671 RepID=A0A1X7PIB8_9MICO|nr:M81 family metallopeptidase [Rathayibacter oskolensis]SMH50405.1 Microcystin degradation protein MlrC, contains DUF1485 domain [Rathayibacter oskolensis]
MRIAIVGVHIESSTFTAHVTTESDFSFRRGQELVESFPFAEWLGEETAAQIEWVPVVHAVTGASGPIDPVLFDALLEEIRETLTAAGPVDGVYLPIHGAATVLGREDAEEALVGLVRDVVGPGPVLSASMDPHGNLSETLAGLVDLAACHRHAPHIDHLLTRERAVQNLVATIRRGTKPAKAWVRIPVLLPGERTSTVVEPGRSVFGRLLPAIVDHGVLDANLYIGFAWADEPRCAASAFVTGDDAEAALACAEELARAYWDAREDFAIVVDHVGSFAEALDFVDSGAPAPVVISDSGDNVTAGGSGDLTYALHETMARPLTQRRRILFTGITDPAAVAEAVAAGAGATLTLSIGAGLDPRHGGPVAGPWRVVSLVPSLVGDPEPVGALLRGRGVDVLVQRSRSAFIAPGDPAFPPGVQKDGAWIDPTGYDAVVVKNGYQFPTQLAVANSSFLALTPGGTDLDPERIRFTRVHRPLFPLDRDFPVDLTARLVPSAS